MYSDQRLSIEISVDKIEEDLWRVFFCLTGLFCGSYEKNLKFYTNSKEIGYGRAFETAKIKKKNLIFK